MENTLGFDVVTPYDLESIMSDFPENILSFDLSVRSSGVVVKAGGTYFTTNIGLGVLDKNDVFAYTTLVSEFKGKLLEWLVSNGLDDIVFDLVCCEDVVYGVSGEVNRKLGLLNYAVEEMVVQGDLKLKDKNFVKVGNTVWKRHLKVLDISETKVKKLKNKVEIRNILDSYNLDFLGLVGLGDLSQADFENKGYQDIYDALGVLIGFCLSKQSAEVSENTKKRVKRKYKVLDEEYIEGNDFKLGNKKMFFKDFRMVEVSKSGLAGLVEVQEQQTIYKVDSLGLFGLQNKLTDVYNKESGFVLLVVV